FQMRKQRGARVMNATMDGSRGIQSEALREMWPDTPETVEGGAERRELGCPAELIDHARPAERPRVPHVAMRTERAHFGRRDAAQLPGPVLWIVHIRGRRRERLREAALLPEDLGAEIEPRGEPG